MPASKFRKVVRVSFSTAPVQQLTRVLAAGALLVMVVGTATAVRAATESGRVFTACADKQGTLSLLHDGKCRASAKKVSINSRGPRGPSGVDGANEIAFAQTFPFTTTSITCDDAASFNMLSQPLTVTHPVRLLTSVFASVLGSGQVPTYTVTLLQGGTRLGMDATASGQIAADGPDFGVAEQLQPFTVMGDHS
jgi:hypothetical protein